MWQVLITGKKNCCSNLLRTLILLKGNDIHPSPRFRYTYKSPLKVKILHEIHKFKAVLNNFPNNCQKQKNNDMTFTLFHLPYALFTLGL
jgi:hypothetical protein